MGSRVAANLVYAGAELPGHNRTREKAETWVGEHGGTIADTPAQVRGEVVITVLVDGPQVEEALLGPHGAAAQAGADTVFVDMSTVGSERARAIGERIPSFV